MTGRGSAFDFASFKRAFERQNLDDWVSFYADDAEWGEYRDYSPPRSPNRMVGKRQIAGFSREIYEADLDLTIADELIGMAGSPSASTARSLTAGTSSSTS